MKGRYMVLCAMMSVCCGVRMAHAQTQMCQGPVECYEKGARHLKLGNNKLAIELFQRAAAYDEQGLFHYYTAIAQGRLGAFKKAMRFARVAAEHKTIPKKIKPKSLARYHAYRLALNSKQVSLDAKKARTGVLKTPPEVTRKPTQNAGWSVGRIVGVSLIGVGAMIGAGTGVWYASTNTRYEQQLEDITYLKFKPTSKVEPFYTETDCKTVRDISFKASAVQEWDDDDVEFCINHTANPSTLSNTLYLGIGAGALLAASGLVLFLVSGDSAKEGAFMPVITPGYQGAQMTLSF